ncbi:MAG: hypothetical protein JWP14_1121 [Frankiales bacterium]|nr:hypothetical protein [Frankiales bacterium]
MQTVDVQQDFSLPVDRVYAYLSEHEHLGPMFGATITRLKDGDTTRNGVGSVRRLKIGPLPPFEETVTEAVPDALIRYRITRGSPLRGHEGVLRFTSGPNGGSRVDYTIRFGAVVPLLDRIVAVGLRRNIRRGLKAVDGQA